MSLSETEIAAAEARIADDRAVVEQARADAEHRLRVVTAARGRASEAWTAAGRAAGHPPTASRTIGLAWDHLVSTIAASDPADPVDLASAWLTFEAVRGAEVARATWWENATEAAGTIVADSARVSSRWSGPRRRTLLDAFNEAGDRAAAGAGTDVEGALEDELETAMSAAVDALDPDADLTPVASFVHHIWPGETTSPWEIHRTRLGGNVRVHASGVLTSYSAGSASAVRALQTAQGPGSLITEITEDQAVTIMAAHDHPDEGTDSTDRV